MLVASFGTDFGIAKYPAFLKSADFRESKRCSSGWYFNFADCGDKSREGRDVVLAWFAKQTGNLRYILRRKSIPEVARVYGEAIPTGRARVGMVIAV